MEGWGREAHAETWDEVLGEGGSGTANPVHG